MATQTNGQQNQSQASMNNMYGLNPQQILSMTMTNVITEQMIKIVKSTSGLTFSKICKLFAIISLEEIRKIGIDLMKDLFTYIRGNYLSIFTPLKI
jgi:hypothetical protein